MRVSKPWLPRRESAQTHDGGQGEVAKAASYAQSSSQGTPDDMRKKPLELE